MDWPPRPPSVCSGRSQSSAAGSVVSGAGDIGGGGGGGGSRGGGRGNPFDDEEGGDSGGGAAATPRRAPSVGGSLRSTSSVDGSWLACGSALAGGNPFDVAGGGTCTSFPAPHGDQCQGWPLAVADTTLGAPVDDRGGGTDNNGFDTDFDDVDGEVDDDMLWTVVLSSLPQFSTPPPPHSPVAADANPPSFIDTPGLSSSYLADPPVDGPAARRPLGRRGTDADTPFSLRRAEEDATAWVASARSALASAATHTADVERSLGVIADATAGIADRARALAAGLTAASAAAVAAKTRTVYAAAVADRLAVVARAVTLPPALAADVWGAPVGGAAFVAALGALEGKVAALAGVAVPPTPLGVGAGGGAAGGGPGTTDPGLAAETASAAAVAEVAPKVRLLVHHAAGRAEAVSTARVADLAAASPTGRPAAAAALATVAPHVAFLARVCPPAAARVAAAYTTAASRHHLNTLPRYAAALARQWRRAERARVAATGGVAGGSR